MNYKVSRANFLFVTASRWVWGTFAAFMPFASHAQTYVFSDLGGLSNNYSAAADINDLGQIVGVSANSDFKPVATYWDHGVVRELDVLGTANSSSYASRINNNGLVVGGTIAKNGAQQAGFWSDQGYRVLGSLGGANSYASAINNSNQIVGYSQLASGGYRATAWINGSPIQVGPTAVNYESFAYGINDVGTISIMGGFQGKQVSLWDTNSYIKFLSNPPINGRFFPQDINNDGTMVGHMYSDFSTDYIVPTIWANDVYTELPTLGGDTGFTTSINDMGQVVGYSSITTGESHATLWQGGSAIDLNNFLPQYLANEGWVIVSANSINNHGSIVGSVWNKNLSLQRAYLLVPSVPEASTIAQMFLGLICLMALTHRRLILPARKQFT